MNGRAGFNAAVAARDERGGDVVARKANQLIDAKRVLAEMSGTSDRAAAIVGAALVEDGLVFAICHKIGVGYASDEASSLCEDRGPLGTFDQKIRMAKALGLFSASVTQGDLDLVRKIRNDFAHDLNLSSFADHSVRQRIEAMHIAKDSVPARMRPPSYKGMSILAVQVLFGLLIATSVPGEA